MDNISKGSREITRLDKVVYVPEIIFAYKFKGKSVWEIKSWECDKAELDKEIMLAKWDLDQLVILHEHRIPKGLNGLVEETVAAVNSWSYDPRKDGWVPMADECTPLSEGAVVDHIAFNLVFIQRGRLVFDVQASSTKIGVQLLSNLGDLVELVKFYEHLKCGKHPHIVFVGRDLTYMTVFSHDDNRVRLRVRSHLADGEEELIDVLLPRDELLSSLKSFILNIANHADFARGWFGNGLQGHEHIHDEVISECRKILLALEPSLYCYQYKKWLKVRQEGRYQELLLNALDEGQVSDWESDRQGKLYRLAYKLEGKEGWQVQDFVKDPKQFMPGKDTEEGRIIEQREICQFYGRPIHNGIFYFGHQEHDAEDWQYDRFKDCWRAPEGEVDMPSWSIPHDELERRISAMKVVAPTLTRVKIEFFDDVNQLLHEEVRVFDKGDESNNSVWQAASEPEIYAKSIGLKQESMHSAFKVDYFINGEWMEYSLLYRKIGWIDGEWGSVYKETPARSKPVLDIWPDYIEAYAWTEHSSCCNLYRFNNQQDVALIEVEFEHWQAKFEAAGTIDDSGDLDINWPEFHEEGLFLAKKLKAILQDQADVIYSKPYEDPSQEGRFLFVI